MKLASVAGKAGKVASATAKVTKATSTAVKAGTATKVVGTGAAATVVAHADDALRVGRLADDADAFVLVSAELPKASKAVSSFDPMDLDHILTGLDVADLVGSSWEIGEEDYDLGQEGPDGMADALGAFPQTEALSTSRKVGDDYWGQWVRRPEGDRLGVYAPKESKVAFLKPQEK